MIKLVFCLRRLPHLSREAFQQYWFERHAPLVRSHATTLGIRRYVQLHTLDDAVNTALQASRGGPEAYDGVAEALAAATATPEGRAAGAALLDDERKFIDLERSPLFVAVERPIIA